MHRLAHRLVMNGLCHLERLHNSFLTRHPAHLGSQAATTVLQARARLSATHAQHATIAHAASPVGQQQQQLPRFYVEDAALASFASGHAVYLPAEEAKHATRVLRLNEGDELEVCNLQGGLAKGVLRVAQGAPQGPSKKSRKRNNAAGSIEAYVELTEGAQQVPWQGVQWELWCACGSLKGSRGDWLVEKAVELGAHTMLPLLTERSPTCSGADDTADDNGSKRAKRQKPSGPTLHAPIEPLSGSIEQSLKASLQAAPGRMGRWGRLAVAAAKQSLRVHGMRLQQPADMQALLQRMRDADLCMVASAGGESMLRVLERARDDTLLADGQQVGNVGGVSELARHSPGKRTPLCLIIVGPEGDFTSSELQAMREQGAVVVGLGGLRLRVETAAVAAMASAMVFEDSAPKNSGSAYVP